MMNVSQSIIQEADFFAVSLLSGCALVFLYDVLRVFRRLVPRGMIAVAIEDILYWMVCALLVFAMLYRKNDGLIRGFAIGAVAAGMLFYNHFISPRSIRLVVYLVQKLLWLIGLPLRLLKKLLKRPAAFCKKRTLRLGKKGKKLLKKIYKAGRIILCKH